MPEFALELGPDASQPFAVEEIRSGMRVGPMGRHIPQAGVFFSPERREPFAALHLLGDDTT